MEPVYRELLAIVLVVGFIIFIVWIKTKLWELENKSVHTCKKCRNVWKLSEMKHYDYEYNYEYRCPQCNSIVVEG